MSSVPPPLPELPELPDGIAPPPRLPPRRLDAGEPLPHWQPWTAPVALVSVFAMAIVGAIVIGAIAALFGASFDDPPPAVNIIATIVQDAAFVGAALIFAKMTERLAPAQFGLRRTRVASAIGWSVATLFAFYLLSGIWAALLDITESSELPQSLGADESTAALVAVCVLVVVIAPICEELFFRGFFFTALWRWAGPWIAALLTGAVFGLIHAGSAEAEFLVPLAILGFLLCLLRWKTGSLLPCMVVHAVNNSIAFGVNQEWLAWQVILLMVGANAVILLACRPFLRRPGRPIGARPA